MNMKNNFSSASLIIVFFLSSCSNFISLPGISDQSSQADISFNAVLSSPPNNGEKIYLEILDEITGVNLNPKRFKMAQAGENIYTFNMSFPAGSVVHYRYFKSGENSTVERDHFGEPVIYRLVHAKGSDHLEDRIISWEDSLDTNHTGEISGYIFDETTNVPLGEVLVFINGLRTFTTNDGYYQFNHLPVGEFNLLAIHPDGRYQTFQQKAVIADNAITPASFGMKPSKFVTVNFIVRGPENTPDQAVIRMLGNLFSMGNSYSLFPDGTSIVSSRSPQIVHQDGEKFTIALELPAGFDLRYKYSLGDGLINAEHDEEGEFLTRQLIVPNRNATVNDEIFTWFSKVSRPVIFNIQVPESATNDSLSIQFNPFTWMNPFPIWELSDTQWTYTLFSPFEYLQNAQFRFCQNNQCGSADDLMTKGSNPSGYLLTHEGEFLPTVNYEIEEWSWTENFEYPIIQTDFSQPHNILIKGFALTERFHMDWMPHIQPGLIDAGVAGANWIVVSPGWTFLKHPSINPHLDWRVNPSIPDLLKFRNQANEAGMDIILFPQPYTNNSNIDYWAGADLTFGGWEKWFSQYERMVLHYADFAEQNKISTLIIGGKTVSPSFPNGLLPDGSPSNSPYNSEEKWRALIEKVQVRFNGQIGFALPSNAVNADEINDIIQICDFVYLQINSPIYETPTPDAQEIEIKVGQMLDQDAYKLYATFQKPIIISLDYYAVGGSGADCRETGMPCQHLYLQSLGKGDIEANFIEQADLYQAFLRTVIQKPWISGIVSEGYHPVISNQDASNSVRGKPAMQVINYFYNNLKR